MVQYPDSPVRKEEISYLSSIQLKPTRDKVQPAIAINGSVNNSWAFSANNRGSEKSGRLEADGCQLSIFARRRAWTPARPTLSHRTCSANPIDNSSIAPATDAVSPTVQRLVGAVWQEERTKHPRLWFALRSWSFLWVRLKPSFETMSVSLFSVIHLFSVELPTPRS